jgi:hypothetical protein
MSDVYKPAIYVLKKDRPKGFKFIITIDGKDELVKFTDGRYECPSAEHELIIASVMHKPSFMQNIQKVDFAAAESIVAAHKQASRPDAVKGGATTESIKQMENDVARQDAEKVADVLAKDSNLMMTHEIVDSNGEHPSTTSNVKLSIGKK